MKTCISQRSKWLTKYNMVIITENYHVISILNFLVPLSDCQQIVQTFDKRKKYNGIKIGGKICFREDIDVFIRMHKLINLKNSVDDQLKWFSHSL